MRIVQTVFGVFHHFELARQLQRRGHLQTIYSTWPWMRLKREGLPRNLVETFPWFHTPEMLLLRAGFHHTWSLDQLSYANAIAFDEWTSRRIKGDRPPDALIALSGSSLKTGRELQARGGRVICDRGSSHQRYQEQIVSEEYRRWRVTRPVTDMRDIVREEKIYEMSDAISVPSSFAARSFVESGLPAEKIHVIPYGVRLEQFLRTGEPPKDRFEVLFAGSVGLRKGFPYLLEAFSKLKHGGKRLRVAGSMHPDLGGVLEHLPRSQVEFLGPVSQPRLAELMSTSHVMVLPSIEEGLALVQGQALACGCPVLASTNTGGEDLFSDGVEGYIVPVRDVAALTERMQQLADDPALQQRMSEAALRRVRTIGGWDEYGDRWENLLSQLTGK
jgi:glycosyltransferase involved in cell wall biosynthesis